MESNADQARASLPGFDYKLYGDAEVQEFLSAHFSRDVLIAYRKLVPYSYKSDFARFCILYEMGGWYVDVGLRLTGAKVVLADDVSLLTFRDINKYSGSSCSCSAGAIYASPRHPTTLQAIEMIVENVKSKYYGITPLCPTGPTLWGRAIAAVGFNGSCIFGDFLELTPTHSQKNKAMVLPDGTIFAFNKPSGGGDLASLGAKGSNNYNDIWRSRQVYQA